jgi:hypothetical protein
MRRQVIQKSLVPKPQNTANVATRLELITSVSISRGPWPYSKRTFSWKDPCSDLHTEQHDRGSKTYTKYKDEIAEIGL